MITQRLDITVPADGVLEPIQTAARVIYVEESLINTPGGVPLILVEKQGDGFPAYSRSSIRTAERITRFWVKGTADAAGSSLRLFIAEDPCADFDSFSFRDCPDDTAIEEPTGTPTHILTASTTAIRVYDLAGVLVREIVGTGTYNHIRGIHVDFGTETIYFFGTIDDGAGNLIARLFSVGFAGGTVTELWDSTQQQVTSNCFLDWDEGLGKFVVGVNSDVWTVNKDGSSAAILGAVSLTVRDLAGMSNGLYVRGASTSITTRDYATNTIQNSISQEGHSLQTDLITERIFTVLGHEALVAWNYSLGDGKTIEPGSAGVSSGNHNLETYGRWLYYTMTSGEFKRVHMDDYDTIESLGTNASVNSLNHPWWE